MQHNLIILHGWRFSSVKCDLTILQKTDSTENVKTPLTILSFPSSYNV